MSLQLTKSGLNGITIAAPDQTITVEGYYQTELHPDKDETFSIKVPLKDIQVDLNHHAEDEDEERDTIRSVYPTELLYWKGKWVLEF